MADVDLSAERSVLGSMLYGREWVEAAAAILTEDDFAEGAHAALYATLLEMADQNSAIDVDLVAAALRKANRMGVVGGVSVLADLLSEVPAAGNVRHYARLVKEAAQLRRLALLTQDIHKRAVAGRDSAEALVETLAEETSRICSGRSSRAVTLSAALKAYIQEIEEIGRNGPAAIVRTGFERLDQLFGGMEAGTLTLIGARPSHGKTTLARQIALHNARQWKCVALFSLETRPSALAGQILGQLTGIHRNRLVTRGMDADALAKLGEAVATVGSVPLILVDEPRLTLAALRGLLRGIMRKQAVSLVVIDYLQLMAAPRAERRDLAIQALSRGLKIMAGELRVPFLVLTQLNRNVETRGDRRPALADLRESGALEQDADAVLLLHRPLFGATDAERSALLMSGKSSEDTFAWLDVKKDRNGPTGDVKIGWDTQHVCFTNDAL